MTDIEIVENTEDLEDQEDFQNEPDNRTYSGFCKLVKQCQEDEKSPYRDMFVMLAHCAIFLGMDRRTFQKLITRSKVEVKLIRLKEVKIRLSSFFLVIEKSEIDIKTDKDKSVMKGTKQEKAEIIKPIDWSDLESKYSG